MTILVCLDRDGTINRDENYFLGSKPYWKKQVEILPKVIEGIKVLNKISDLEIFIVSNQSGVALNSPEFNLLDETRANEVNQYLIELLKQNNAKIRGSFICPYVTEKYAEKSRERGREVNEIYIQDNHPDMKPNIGMIERAAESIGKDLEKIKLYYVGDRLTDVQTGLNAGGVGILITSYKTRELGDEIKVKELQRTNSNRFYIAKNFLDAAEYIREKESK